MPEGKGAPPSTGRHVLPGIPSYVDRVSAESIWRTNCKSEAEYLRKRRSNPPKSRQHFGALHGFEVVKHPTYVSVRRLPEAEAGEATAGASRPGSTYGDEDGASSVFRSDPLPNNPGTTFVLPKYSRFSTEHMTELERNPHGSRTAQGLRRVLSMPGAHERVRRECGRLKGVLPRPPLLSLEECGDGRQLRAEIEGPEGTPFEARQFGVEIEVGDEYPFKPPSVRFASPRRVFHPNVCPRTGGVCLDILNNATLWSPSFGLERLLVGVTSLLSEPRTEHGLNSEALALLQQDPAAFASRAAADAAAPRGRRAGAAAAAAAEAAAAAPAAATAAAAAVAAPAAAAAAPPAAAATATAAAPVAPVPAAAAGAAAANARPAACEPVDHSGACWAAVGVLLVGIALAQRAAAGG